jgi:predicted RNase H-like nuclease
VGSLRFVGIDLAWSEKNPSGVAVIDSAGIVQKASSALWTNDEICRFADLDSSEGAVIAVDAPLTVTNPIGQRSVERELTSIFGLYDAAPHSANLSNPNFQESGRIQQLTKQLVDLGFSQTTTASKLTTQRVFLEVFPAPSLVVLFPCLLHTGHCHCRPPRYKQKSGRRWPEVHSEWEIYRARLRSLECREPALQFSAEVHTRIGVDIAEHRGVKYKGFDDLLDGIFCAYLAYYFWRRGEEDCQVVGDPATGSVTIPKCQLANCPLMQRPKG